MDKQQLINKIKSGPMPKGSIRMPPRNPPINTRGGMQRAIAMRDAHLRKAVEAHGGDIIAIMRDSFLAMPNVNMQVVNAQLDRCSKCSALKADGCNDCGNCADHWGTWRNRIMAGCGVAAPAVRNPRTGTLPLAGEKDWLTSATDVPWA
jgi:hypothetical protein